MVAEGYFKQFALVELIYPRPGRLIGQERGMRLASDDRAPRVPCAAA